MKSVPVWLRYLAVVLLAVAASVTLDAWVYDHVIYERVYEEDWGRLLRVQGFWPLWLLAAVALVMNDWPARAAGRLYPAIMRGWLLIASATTAGLVGEVLKILLRRERPRAHDGEYFFRSFADRPLSSSGLALPSSHTIVAFGAAFMLARLFPRAWPVWYLLAAGCGLTRLFVQAHFLSDVVVAALAAWAVAAVVWHWHRRRLSRATGDGFNSATTVIDSAEQRSAIQ
jgi:membrane-associated phospholipid phosphatase